MRQGVLDAYLDSSSTVVIIYYSQRGAAPNRIAVYLLHTSHTTQPFGTHTGYGCIFTDQKRCDIG
jgi:hypothetical protein